MPINIGNTLVESLAIGDKAIEMIAQGGDVIHTSDSNMLPMPMIDVTETVYITESDITLTCNANDPDHTTGFTYTWSENADFSSPFATVTGAGTTNVQTVTGPNAAGDVTYYCQVTDDAGGVGSSQITITWALGAIHTLTSSLAASFNYAGSGSTITFTSNFITSANLPTTNTNWGTFTIRDGGTNFADETRIVAGQGFTGTSFRKNNATSDTITITCANELTAQNMMAIIEGETGWDNTTVGYSYPGIFGTTYNDNHNNAPNTSDNNITILV